MSSCPALQVGRDYFKNGSGPDRKSLILLTLLSLCTTFPLNIIKKEINKKGVYRTVVK